MQPSLSYEIIKVILSPPGLAPLGYTIHCPIIGPGYTFGCPLGWSEIRTISPLVDSAPVPLDMALFTVTVGCDNDFCNSDWPGIPFQSGSHLFCLLAWSEIRTISPLVDSAPVPLDMALFTVTVGCDNDFCNSDWPGIPFQSGSHLFCLLAWSHRQTLSEPSVIYAPEIHALQPNITSPDTSITSFTLTQFPPDPIRCLRDTADTSFLSGTATFGGFWTFVNGPFALFFGANVVYFAFGHFLHWEWCTCSSDAPWFGSGTKTFRRSRRKGVCQVQKVPALLHSCGKGLSILAKILATSNSNHAGRSPKNGKLRKTFPWKKKVQRLNSRGSTRESDDFEPTHTAVSSTREVPLLTAKPHDSATSHPEAPEPRSRRGCILDEIPLLDVDLGFSDILLQSQNIQGTEDLLPSRR
ncbi:hypothetical protein C8R45DRAFT_1083847 [Mycena sanguinolenta]|nr:hypothetical protein C8R45DRAFT_1083847 [Mycena sanguinolenta]